MGIMVNKFTVACENHVSQGMKFLFDVADDSEDFFV
jgi:hypothetical protein